MVFCEFVIDEIREGEKMKKKVIMTAVVSVFLTCVVCTLIFFAYKDKQDKAQQMSLEGTYEFNLDGVKGYIAVIPSDDGKREYQWYSLDNKILFKGKYKMKKYKYVTLYEDSKSIATIFVSNGRYYFVNESLEPEEIVKTADEAIVKE